ncbi:MAG: hypothetical protein J5722_08930, partial [Oscillospiraceae bacterium]|nr:hypothetical protein [Oscillospiraceae bacterium]
MTRNRPLRTKMLLPVTAYYILCVLLMMPSLLQSRYLFAAPAEITALVLSGYLMIVLVFLTSKRLSCVMTALAAASLSVANISQPLTYYACRLDADAAAVMNKLCRISLVQLIFLSLTWVMLAVLDKLAKKRAFLLLPGSLLICAPFLLLVLYRSSENSATSAVENGFQPAILMAFLILFCFAAALGRYSGLQTVLQMLLCGCMVFCLIFRHELGIPILCTVSCLLFYLLLYPLPKGSFLLIAALAGLTGGLLLIRFGSDALLTDTLNKITTRTHESNQLTAVIRTLQTTGWFGRFSYDVRVSAVASDFSLANSVHYMGYLWLAVTFLPFCLGLLGTLLEENIPHGFAPSVMLRGLCAVTIA